MIDRISTRIFADGADLDGILRLAADPRISGFTTNPTLMWKAGLTEYADFAERLLERITKHPISFEVFADDEAEIRRQARRIAGWGKNVYVKIPVTTTSGESLAPLVRELSEDGVQVNVTALFTTAQVELITAAVRRGRSELHLGVRRPDRRRRRGPAADHGALGRDHERRSARGAHLGQPARGAQRRAGRPGRLPHHHDDARPAEEAGSLGKNLEQFSLETVQMFRRDAIAAGFTL